MKKHILYIVLLYIIGNGCSDKLDVQQAYKFTIESMPVPTQIAKDETIEIRSEIKREGEYKDTKYYIRYFQPQGNGILKNAAGMAFTPNDRYSLESAIFRLYYTSECSDPQVIDIYIEDNFGQMEKVTFSFTNRNQDNNETK